MARFPNKISSRIDDKTLKDLEKLCESTNQSIGTLVRKWVVPTKQWRWRIHEHFQRSGQESNLAIVTLLK